MRILCTLGDQIRRECRLEWLTLLPLILLLSHIEHTLDIFTPPWDTKHDDYSGFWAVLQVLFWLIVSLAKFAPFSEVYRFTRILASWLKGILFAGRNKCYALKICLVSRFDLASVKVSVAIDIDIGGHAIKVYFCITFFGAIALDETVSDQCADPSVFEVILAEIDAF